MTSQHATLDRHRADLSLYFLFMLKVMFDATTTCDQVSVMTKLRNNTWLMTCRTGVLTFAVWYGFYSQQVSILIRKNCIKLITCIIVFIIVFLLFFNYFELWSYKNGVLNVAHQSVLNLTLTMLILTFWIWEWSEN